MRNTLYVFFKLFFCISFLKQILMSVIFFPLPILFCIRASKVSIFIPILIIIFFFFHLSSKFSASFFLFLLLFFTDKKMIFPLPRLLSTFRTFLLKIFPFSSVMLFFSPLWIFCFIVSTFSLQMLKKDFDYLFYSTKHLIFPHTKNWEKSWWKSSNFLIFLYFTLSPSSFPFHKFILL